MLHNILFEQLEKLMMLMIDHGLQTDGDVGDDEKIVTTCNLQDNLYMVFEHLEILMLLMLNENKCYNVQQLAGQPVHGVRASGEGRGS